MTLFDRLAWAAARCGVELTTVPPDWRDEDWAECPFARSRCVDLPPLERPRWIADAAIHYDKRIVYAEPSAGPHVLIHELGHVIASPVPLEKSDEGSWLWWEAATALWAGCLEDWHDGQYDYGLTDSGLPLGLGSWGKGNYSELGEVSKRTMAFYAKAARKYGEALGLFDAEGPCALVPRAT